MKLRFIDFHVGHTVSNAHVPAGELETSWLSSRIRSLELEDVGAESSSTSEYAMLQFGGIFGSATRRFMTWTIYLMLVKVLEIQDANAIDCFVCTSINRSDAYCEDSFNTSYPGVDYLQKECMGYRKDRRGYFPADHCIKISGVSTKNYTHSIMIRTCALDSGTLTADTEIVRMSHCGHFIFDGTPFSGCVQSCQTDGCNTGVSTTTLTSSTFTFLCILILFHFANPIL